MKKLLTTILLCPIIISSAQDSTRVDSLKTVQVTSPYLAHDNSYPVTFTNVSQNEIEAVNTGQEPSFILSNYPSMTVYSDAGSGQGYSYFRMRGIDQTRLNLTLDGVPLNEPEDQGVYFSNYPDFFGSINGLQIQRGVGTTKNGNASFGGSMQFQSKELSDSMKTTLGAGYGSFNSYRFFAEHNMGLKKDVGLYIRASHIHSDGYRRRSANTSNSVFYSTGIVKKKHVLKLTGFAGNQRNQMAWLGVSKADIDNDARQNNNSEENDQFTQSLNQISHSVKLGTKSFLKSTVYYNYLEGYYDFDLNNFLGLPSTDEMYNYAFQSHFLGGFTNFNYFGEKLTWRIGVHGNIYQRKHTGSERLIGKLYQNRGFKNSFSAFTKADYSVTKSLKLFADIQYRYTDFDYEGAVDMNKRDWNFINPKAGLSYQIKSNFLYYSFGAAGREPTRTDMFGGNDDLLADSTGAAILFITSPEFVLDHELGWRYQAKKLQTSFNLYYMAFQNEIVLNGQFGPNALALNDRVDQSYRTGAELSIAFHPLKALSLIHHGSINFSQITDSGVSFEPILTPRYIFNQEIVYRLSGFETGLSLRFQSKSYIDFANENELDAYALLNWRASYSVKGFTVSVFLNNITNKRYFNNGYVDWDGTNKYFVQATSNVYAMLTYSF